MRQVHLDFHTSRDFAEVGSRFDADEFAATMAQAHVAAVNVFAKCHHGYSYYPTAVGTQHPGLAFDLLGSQIAALHTRGIRAPVYLSILWDDLAGEEHPEWVVTDRTGRSFVRRPLSSDTPLRNQVGWSTMDIASGYAEYVRAQVEEICRRYPVDGFWFDIVWPEPSYAPHAQRAMREADVDIADEQAVRSHYQRLLHALCVDLRATVGRHHPDATVFFNGTVDALVGDMLDVQTHLEVESLPTSGDVWGYTHYPVVARHARTKSDRLVGMTGRFHAAWADFGGLKTPAQLEYEVGTIIGAGAAVCIGDQLHPDGRLDAAVYRTIGQAFGRLERLEQWWAGGRRCTEVAVLGDWRYERSGERLVATHTPAVAAAVQVLLELAVQVDVVDPDVSDLGPYRAVVVPDGMMIEEPLLGVLKAFRAGGGTLVLTADSFLGPDGEAVLADLPFRHVGPTPTTPCYVRPTRAGVGPLEPVTDYDYVLYDGGHLVEPTAHALTEGTLRRATFDRRWDHFTSHMHAPVGDDLGAPLLVAGEDVVYLAAPLFSSYGRHQYWVYRSFIGRALTLALGEQMLVRTGPAWVEATLHTQGAGVLPDRYVVNLTAYQPRRTSSSVPRVDEGGFTAGINLSIAAAAGFTAATATLEPAGTPLEVSMRDGRVELELPPIGTHSVVVVHREAEAGEHT